MNKYIKKITIDSKVSVLFQLYVHECRNRPDKAVLKTFKNTEKTHMREFAFYYVKAFHIFSLA